MPPTPLQGYRRSEPSVQAPIPAFGVVSGQPSPSQCRDMSLSREERGRGLGSGQPTSWAVELFPLDLR